MMEKMKSSFELLKKSVNDFLDNNALKYAASLSYYTVFSIPPVLVIIISLTGYVWGQEAVRGEVFQQLSGLLGADSATMIQNAIEHVSLTGQSLSATIIGLVTLAVGATGAFTELQDSLNSIWSLKPKPKSSLLKFIINRVISFSMILSLGFLLLASLAVDMLVNLLSQSIFSKYEMWVWMAEGINSLLVLGTVSTLFAFLFKFLPDARISWKDTYVGAVFTAILFMLGKFAIGFYLSNSEVATAYGAAGSFAIVLVWIYYSSAILFFGAEFTKNYAIAYGDRIVPDDYAVFVVQEERKLRTEADACEMQAEKDACAEKMMSETE